MNTTIQNLEMEKSPQKTNYTNDILIVIFTAVYCFLFYNQGIGINYFIFSLLVSIIFLWRDKSLLKSASFIIIGLTTILSGFLCFYFGTDYHLFMHKLSMLILAGITFSPKSSLIVALIQSIYTFVLSPVFIISDFFSLKSQPINRLNSILKYAVLSIVPIAIALFFLFIYAASNPILSNVLSTIKWNFLSISFIFFSIYAFVFSFGIIKQRNEKSLSNYDEIKSDNLVIEHDVLHKSILNFFSLKSEIYIACSVFVLLNLVIGLNNSTDIYYLFIKKVLPLNLSFTDFLHQGVNSLILSIFFAIGLIMYFFSSRLNFIKNSIYVKLIAYVWIIQNGVLVYLCFYKNMQYITQFGLTYKRIGVYTFLVVALIGLVLTAIKILKNKTNFFLFRKNSWVVYLVLMALGCYDWDYAIVKNNLTSNKDNSIDYNYLISLDHSGLLLLKNHLFKDSIAYNQTKTEVDSLLVDYEDRYLQEPEQRLIQKIENLKKDEKNYGVQSYCLTRKNTLTQLNK